MDSIWSNTVEIGERAPLKSDLRIDTVVIGGGMAGILTALLLREKGVEAVVFEAARIGSGQTKGTTAKITAQHNLIYARLIREYGERRARQYADMNTRAISEYRRIIEERGIECHFEEVPAYLYTNKSPELLKQECEAALSLSLDASFVTETTLPFPVSGALRFGGQAIFNPLEFLKAVAEELNIYENTRAIKVDGGTVQTDGGTVTADRVVFATHFPFINVPGWYFVKMHQGRSYVLALETEHMLDGAYLGIDDDSLSFRRAGNVLLLGGGGHRTGENLAGGKYQLLRNAAGKLFPQAKEFACWSAQDCMTPDGIPYIGHYSRSKPDWYVETGFNKWGMTGSMAAAMIISEMIAGKRHPDAACFSPRRQTTGSAAKAVGKNMLKAADGLGKEIFVPSTLNTDAIPAGHGSVVDYAGEKFGVYKDDAGGEHIVSVRCPHLGCQLEWNPDEKSWDCPCHGSRFDFRGNLLDNPAQKDIKLGS